MIWFIFLCTVYEGAWLFPHTHYTGNSLVIYCCVTNDRMFNSLEHVLSLFLWVGSLKGDWQSDIITVAQKAGPGGGGEEQSFQDLGRVEGSIVKMSHTGASWQKASVSYPADILGTLQCLPQREGEQASAASFKIWSQKSQPSCLRPLEKQVTKSSPYSKGTKLSLTSWGARIQRIYEYILKHHSKLPVAFVRPFTRCVEWIRCDLNVHFPYYEWLSILAALLGYNPHAKSYTYNCGHLDELEYFL